MSERFRVMTMEEFLSQPVRVVRRKAGRIEQSTEPVAVRGEPLHDVWWQGRQWAVTSYGIEARDGRYVIEKGRLGKNLPEYSWAEHMSGKAWVDIDDFMTAWLVAMAMHGDGPGSYTRVRGAISRTRPGNLPLG